MPQAMIKPDRRVDESLHSSDIDFVIDVPLTVKVELGQSEITIRELMSVEAGSVIPLNKLAGEPLEVYINTKKVARGEVVVCNDKFAIRLTDLITP